MRLGLRDRLRDTVAAVRRLAATRDRRSARAELGNERTEDLAIALSRVEPEEAAAVLQDLDIFQAAELMVEMPTETVRQIAQELPDDVIAAYLDILPMDDAIDLQEELGDERFEALLEVIPQEDAKEIRRLLAYPEETVGRLMTEHYFWVQPDQTASEILEDLRRASEDKYESVNDLYVVDDNHRLIGVTSLRRILRVPPGTKVADIMQGDPISVEATEDEEMAARLMVKYGFYALPVVDETGRLLGIFTGDDAQDILQEAETEDVLAVGGVSGDAEPYMSLSPWQLYRRRIPWLMALFVAETLTGAVMRHYGESDPGLGVGQLMFFVPLILGAGGNSGAQVTTTITRALALDEVESRDWMPVLFRELAVAAMIGASLGLLGFLRARFGWQSDLSLSLVVALALPTVVLWAATVGSVLPLAAKRLGIDPAVMSAPFITTFVDATGLIIYFEFARRLLA
ncbi:magnesium transporter [Kamptonema cortianum]|nr:magnesium transporter [Geitlerinema splendidum]MDK3158463.1 magnesium transporter [Kamptonema cortianum]